MRRKSIWGSNPHLSATFQLNSARVASHMEGWQSGRMRRSRKSLYRYSRYLGFESLSLRQNVPAGPIFRVCSFFRQAWSFGSVRFSSRPDHSGLHFELQPCPASRKTAPRKEAPLRFLQIATAAESVRPAGLRKVHVVRNALGDVVHDDIERCDIRRNVRIEHIGRVA